MPDSSPSINSTGVRVRPQQDPDAMLAGFSEQIAGKLQQADQLSQAATEVRATASSTDGGITVAVDQRGNPVDLDIADKALRQRPNALQGVLDTIRAAQGELTGRMCAAMKPVLGTDTETLEAVLRGTRERFPEPTEPRSAAVADAED